MELSPQLPVGSAKPCTAGTRHPIHKFCCHRSHMSSSVLPAGTDCALAGECVSPRSLLPSLSPLLLLAKPPTLKHPTETCITHKAFPTSPALFLYRSTQCPMRVGAGLSASHETGGEALKADLEACTIPLAISLPPGLDMRFHICKPGVTVTVVTSGVRKNK